MMDGLPRLALSNKTPLGSQAKGCFLSEINTMAYVEVKEKMEEKMMSIGTFFLVLLVSWLLRMVTDKLGSVQPANKFHSVTWNS